MVYLIIVSVMSVYINLTIVYDHCLPDVLMSVCIFNVILIQQPVDPGSRSYLNPPQQVDPPWHPSCA